MTKSKIRVYIVFVSSIVFAVVGAFRTYATLTEEAQKTADYVLEICAGLLMAVALSLLDIWFERKKESKDAKSVRKDS